MEQFVYDGLKENIEDAKKGSFFTKSVGFMMLGRIDFGAERGDISLSQMEELENMVVADCRSKHYRVMVIANTDIPDEALEHTP